MAAMADRPYAVEAYRSRADWGADPLTPNAAALPTGQFEGWVLHHTVFVLTDYDRDGFLRGDLDDVDRYMRVLQKARPDLGLEVPYSWVLFPGSTDDRGIIAEGRGRGRKGAHTAGLNSTRYAIAVAGNTDDEMPITPGMVAAARWLMAEMLDRPEAAVPTIGHRQAPPYIDSKGQNLNATGCPGDDGIAALAGLQPPFTVHQEDIVTPDDIEAIAKRVTAWLANPQTNPGTVIDPGARAALGRLDVAVNDPAAGVRAILAHASDAAGVTVDPHAIAAAVVEALPPDLAHQVLVELGNALPKS